MATIALIAAMAKNRVIGKDNKLPWDIPADLKFFRVRTKGKPCIMGRKTYESIYGYRQQPLPKRLNIVVSRSADKADEMFQHENVVIVRDIASAVALAEQNATETVAEEIMVIGGTQLYQQFIEQELAEKIYLTEVDLEPEGDAHFPEFDRTAFELASREEVAHEPPFAFCEYVLRRSA